MAASPQTSTLDTSRCPLEATPGPVSNINGHNYMKGLTGGGTCDPARRIPRDKSHNASRALPLPSILYFFSVLGWVCLMIFLSCFWYLFPHNRRQSISFSHCCDLTRSGFILAHSFRGHSPSMAEKVWWQESEAPGQFVSQVPSRT